MTTSQAADRVPLTGLKEEGRLTFCTDIGYPPMEFYDDDRQPTGADIEIARALAKRLGREAVFIDQPVEGIIDALCEMRSDLIINAFTDNALRRNRLTFVDYLCVGQTVVVPSGNPLRIRSI